MKTKTLTLAIACLMASNAAFASISIQLQVGSLRTQAGSIIAPGTIAVLASDTNGFSSQSALETELLGKTLSVGTTFSDFGKILGVFNASDLSGSGEIGLGGSTVLDLAALGLTGSANNTTATDLAVLWFPGLTTVGSTLSQGQSFGFYRSDTTDALSGGDMSFNVPTDGFPYTLAAYDNTLGGGGNGSVLPSTFNAAGTVGAVPEPSRSMLALIGLTCLLGRRKRI